MAFSGCLLKHVVQTLGMSCDFSILELFLLLALSPGGGSGGVIGILFGS
jgi:hypothetical protein